MLVNTRSDSRFQRYLDQQELKLFRAIMPVIVAGTKLHATRNHIRAQDYMNKRGADVLLQTYKRIYADQFQAVSEQLETVTKDAKPVTAFLRTQVDWLKQHSGNQIRTVSAGQAKDIGELISRMTAEGKSNQQITAEIRKLAPDLSRGRASTIARTETHNAALEAIVATLDHARQKVQTKTWQTAGDNKVRPSHAAVDGETIPFDDLFDVGGAKMFRPGDQSHGAGADEIVNCRCALLFNVGGKMPPPEMAPPKGIPIEGTTSVSAQFATTVRAALDAIPPIVTQAIANAGVKMVVGRIVSEVYPELKGVRPRGWPRGTTWDNAEGLFHRGKNEMVLTEMRKSQVKGRRRELIPARENTKGVAWHEAGHAFDQALAAASSNDPKFVAAYNADVAEIKGAELRKSLGYYLQKAEAGRSEAFAEVFGQLVALGTATSSFDLRRYFPRVAQWLTQAMHQGKRPE